MARVHRYLPPADICNLYDSLGGGQSVHVIDGFWDKFADGTVRCISDGARTLGQLWQAAYDLNQQPEFAEVITPKVLRKIYENKEDFVPSLHLANLDEADYPIAVGHAGGH